ncbi:unnamed protein product [Chondrus crispus]|uniref:Uncharacterized protein n=1 Tax=Chondrus crispus TaxID=2769 RepID=R7QKN5_CHOCR|nr:unnamed protein product [Chondrus crispus]CDF38338.1 unnamed protein product [Chondrus crispus]|eukprot:XP_005718223.1 unnamed protein product [Chondrus crispus]
MCVSPSAAREALLSGFDCEGARVCFSARCSVFEAVGRARSDAIDEEADGRAETQEDEWGAKKLVIDRCLLYEERQEFTCQYKTIAQRRSG